MNEKILICGAGQGGHAIAGYAATLGNEVSLYTHTPKKAEIISSNGNKIKLTGILDGEAQLRSITTNLQEAVSDNKYIFIITDATVHKYYAERLAPILTDQQVMLISPGIGGALEFLNLVNSIENIKRNYGLDLQEKLYGNKKDFIDENCECDDAEEIYTDEENIGVDIKPGYFYYDKSAPKQKLMSNGGDMDNVQPDANKTAIYDKIDWANHDKVTSDKNNTKSYRINPNNYDVYESGKLVDDSTYTVNL